MKFSETGRGTYAAIKFTDKTKDQLVALQEQLELYNPTPREKLHTTICFSRVYIPFKTMPSPGNIGPGNKLTVFEHNGKRALVLLLDSPYLHERFDYAMALGATYDFPDYQPHITLSYDIGAREVPALPDHLFIEAAEEYVEDLDLDWKA